METEFDILTEKIKALGCSYGCSSYVDDGNIRYCVDALSLEGHRHVVRAESLVEALKELEKELNIRKQ